VAFFKPAGVAACRRSIFPTISVSVRATAARARAPRNVATYGGQFRLSVISGQIADVTEMTLVEHGRWPPASPCKSGLNRGHQRRGRAERAGGPSIAARRRSSDQACAAIRHKPQGQFRPTPPDPMVLTLDFRHQDPAVICMTRPSTVLAQKAVPRVEGIGEGRCRRQFASRGKSGTHSTGTLTNYGHRS